MCEGLQLLSAREMTDWTVPIRAASAACESPAAFRLVRSCWWIESLATLVNYRIYAIRLSAGSLILRFVGQEVSAAAAIVRGAGRGV